MPQPNDYSLDIPSPTQNVMDTLNIGQGITQLKTQQQAVEQSKLASQRLNIDLASLADNPTPGAIVQIMAKHPQLSEPLKRVYDTLSAEQQKTYTSQASNVYAALESGENEIAQDILNEAAEASRNSGDEERAKAAEALSKLIELHPETAKTSTALFLANSMGGEKFVERFAGLQSERREAALDPAKLTTAQANARKAAIAADFEESNAVMDLKKKGWDIYKIQEDANIARENVKIASLKAKAGKGQDALKRQELEIKIEEAKEKRDQYIRDKSADVSAANTNIDNMLTTADRILKVPSGVLDDAMGPIDSRLPTLSQDVADFEALIENIDAQAFLAQIPNLTGLGALSDAEGKKITAALQSFSLKQSPESLIYNVKEAQRLLMKARENIANRYGVQQTMPDTPEASSTPDEINDLLELYGQ